MCCIGVYVVVVVVVVVVALSLTYGHSSAARAWSRDRQAPKTLKYNCIVFVDEGIISKEERNLVFVGNVRTRLFILFCARYSSVKTTQIRTYDDDRNKCFVCFCVVSKPPQVL